VPSLSAYPLWAADTDSPEGSTSVIVCVEPTAASAFTQCLSVSPSWAADTWHSRFSSVLQRITCTAALPHLAQQTLLLLWVLLLSVTIIPAIGALTLLVGRQEEHPACKHSLMRCWCGYLSGARCRLFAYGPADATAIPKTPSSLASFKSRLVLPFWFRLTQVVPEKRSLNGFSGCSSASCSCSYYCELCGTERAWCSRRQYAIC